LNLNFTWLSVVLLVACVTDLTRRKVYNWLTFPAMAVAIGIQGFEQGWGGLGASFFGLIIGGMIFLPIYWAQGMGAGDIKLMAVVGAWMGWKFALNTALNTAILGGLVAVVILLIRGELFSTLGKLLKILLRQQATAPDKSGTAHPGLPYAVVIALGAASAEFFPSLIALP
jgi:prepilin peptidase CpaA